MSLDLREFRGERHELVPILQRVQDHFGYLPEDALQTVAEFLRVSENDAFGVASFFAQFRFARPGRHTVRVCLGTACHVRGGELLLDQVKRQLGIESGETTPDGRFSLERVACLGCCALAPVVMIDKNVHGRQSGAGVGEVLEEYG